MFLLGTTVDRLNSKWKYNRCSFKYLGFPVGKGVIRLLNDVVRFFIVLE